MYPPAGFSYPPQQQQQQYGAAWPPAPGPSNEVLQAALGSSPSVSFLRVKITDEFRVDQPVRDKQPVGHGTA